MIINAHEILHETPTETGLRNENNSVEGLLYTYRKVDKDVNYKAHEDSKQPT
jgi:hypothetical protein